MRGLIHRIIVIVCLFSSTIIEAQITTASQWTWMKGSNIVDQPAPAVYGIKGIPASTNTPGTRGRATKWTDQSGNLWLFGGYCWKFDFDSIYYYNDLWKYNPLINQWTWISGDSMPNQNGIYGVLGISDIFNKPGSRESPVSWLDQSGKLWFFGGDGYDSNSGNHLLNDLWNFNPTTLEWTWVKGDSSNLYLAGDHLGVYGIKGIFNDNNKPGSRRWASSWTDKNNNLWLFGGYGLAAHSGAMLNDLWEYNISTNKWAWIKGDSIANQAVVYGTQRVAANSNDPGARYLSASWTDTANNLWLFCGQYWEGLPSGWLNTLPNDLWKYNIATNQWTWMNGANTGQQSGDFGIQGVPANSNQPPSKFDASACTDKDGNFWMFGGLNRQFEGSGAYDLNDLWKYNAYTNQWTWMYGTDYEFQGNFGSQGIASPDNIIGSRGDEELWADKTGNLWVFGGGGKYYEFNDLWKLSTILGVASYNSTCGNPNGSIIVSATYGIEPYQYSIDGINFQASNTFTGLAAGAYTITVKDNTGDTRTTTANVINESSPALTANTTTSTCSSDNGSITANASGGTPPLQYSINGTTYQSSNVFTGQFAGNYTVYVKDANGCISTTAVTIINESAPSLTATTTAASCTNNDGAITANATGGKAPLQYSLNGSTYQPINLFNGLSSGNYTVYVKDANNCIATYLTTLSSSTPPAISGINIYPNPTNNNQFTIVLGNQLQGTYNIRILDMVGQMVYKTTISNTCTCCTGSYSIKLPFLLSSGIYNVEVLDSGSNKNVQRLMVTSK
jgi:hypothetical protein